MMALHRSRHTDRSHSDISSRCNGTSPRECRILINIVDTRSNNGIVCSDDDTGEKFVGIVKRRKVKQSRGRNK